MLSEIFYWVWNMSITASIAGGIVLLIRRIKRLPRRIAVLLWLIPFLRMSLPFGLDSPWSLLGLLSRLTTRSIVLYRSAGGISFSMLNSTQAADSYFPLIYRTELLERIFQIASIVWITAAAILLLTLAVCYGAALRGIRSARLLRDNIYLSDQVSSPVVCGVLWPKILLPASWADRDCTLPLLHETMHIRRKDNLWRILAVGITAVHWFNPLAWLFLRCFLSDLELACDECVLARLGPERAKDYALCLLNARERSTSVFCAFGGADIRTRIRHILSFRKLTWLSLSVSLLWVAVFACLLLTNAG